jgi:hypothetical protein
MHRVRSSDRPGYDPIMTPARAIRFYGQVGDHAALEWEWVDDQLRRAGTYWVTARTSGHPHPRPVWGIWRSSQLFLSIGTPVTRQALDVDPLVTVHLDSGTEVVIVEGRASGSSDHAELLAEYDEKYDWSYDLTEYGSLTRISPDAVLAWRTAGWAGRDSFQQAGRWVFP